MGRYFDQDWNVFAFFSGETFSCWKILTFDEFGKTSVNLHKKRTFRYLQTMNWTMTSTLQHPTGIHNRYETERYILYHSERKKGMKKNLNSGQLRAKLNNWDASKCKKNKTVGAKNCELVQSGILAGSDLDLDRWYFPYFSPQQRRKISRSGSRSCIGAGSSSLMLLSPIERNFPCFISSSSTQIQYTMTTKPDVLVSHST